jgi:hypothetical protein
MIDEGKIFAWLEKVEGKPTCRGYIPSYLLDGSGSRTGKTINYRGDNGAPARIQPMGASGCTIGVGVDLGWQSESQLRNWGVSEALLRKLRPYLGRKKRDAVIALHQAPLTLTEAEMHELTRAEHHGYLHDEVERVWDYQYAKNGKFADLPWQAQTVIFSCIYQCGWAGFRRRGPATLRALEAHDWPRAVRNLQSGAKGWNGEYHQRRHTEGALLAELCE